MKKLISEVQELLKDAGYSDSEYPGIYNTAVSPGLKGLHTIVLYGIYKELKKLNTPFLLHQQEDFKGEG